MLVKYLAGICDAVISVDYSNQSSIVSIGLNADDCMNVAEAMGPIVSWNRA